MTLCCTEAQREADEQDEHSAGETMDKARLRIEALQGLTWDEQYGLPNRLRIELWAEVQRSHNRQLTVAAFRHRHTGCIVAWWERRVEERAKYDDGRIGAEAAARHRQRLASLGRELVACGALDKQQFEKWNNRRAARHA